MPTPRPVPDRRTGAAGVLSRALFERRSRGPWPRSAWLVGAVLLAGGWLSANGPADAAPAPLAAAAFQEDGLQEDGQDKPVEEAPVAATDEADHAAGEHAGEDHADGEHAGDADHGGSGEKHAEHSAHGSIVAPLLAAIVVILFGAKISGDFFERLGIPSVVGELALGILLGNLVLISDLIFGTELHWLDFLQPPEADEFSSSLASDVGASLALLAEIGVILLLFEVGLECTVREMLRVGWTSLFVAIAGVVAPILLGFVISKAFFFPEPGEWQQPAFIGATLCATSVGITARVLRDMNRHRDKESQIILGAAVIDDVLGLIVLAVVQGAIAASLARKLPGAELLDGGDDPFWYDVASIVGLAAAFLGGALLLGAFQFPRFLFKMASKLRGRGLLVVTALLICFGFSYLADSIGLATIVGAFAAGLILEQAQYKELGEREDVHELEDAIRPLTALFVPIFFVLMGMRVDVEEFAGGRFWVMALTLTGLAILGKMVCSFAAVEKGVNKVAVGIGMVPRGEVGLIFAAVGSTLERWDDDLGMAVSVVDDTTFSAIVFMVIVTTVITPPLLKWSMAQGGAGPGEHPPDDRDIPVPPPDVTHSPDRDPHDV
ncbi:cation:proton antiporter [Alienimonas californiensis]|uniref:High-affinity Na(+)/H(+) antiporter NhaS3 n=1 Tax=Alienimonas californiensis TaxID=2527989 RepID=A0A517P7D0_9PLAN|nr:cation:proton antiporter [Alienimonas californiensis]QDT15284.1 High-affinity Na(+)/H(+) antiporter NhaS3 [Alienimonas californiensis]